MFKVTTAIKKLLRLKNRKKVIQGSSSAGKTFGIIAILINKACAVPGREISVVAESIPHLRRGALKDFKKIMRMTGRWNDNSWSKVYLTYTFANGSYIEFFSADDEQKARGSRRTDLFVNECNAIAYDTFNQLAIRTSGEIWIDFNPTAPFYGTNEIAHQEDSDYLILTYRDNEALPQSIIDELLANKAKGLTSKYWENWARVYVDGQIGNLEGACIPEWTEIDNVPEDAKVCCAGLDFGFTNDQTALVILYYYDGMYIFKEELYKRGQLNSDISDRLKEIGFKGMIWADSAEPKSIRELMNMGHNISKVKKGPDSVVAGISLINQHKIAITKDSFNIATELRNYTWRRDKSTGETLNVPVDKFNHAIDAMRYAMTSYLLDGGSGEYYIW